MRHQYRTYLYFAQLISTNPSLSVYKPIILRLQSLPKNYYESNIAGRLLFLSIAILLPFITILRLKRTKAKSIFFDLSYEAWRTHLRTIFLAYHTLKNGKIVAGSKSQFHYSIINRNQLSLLLRLWLVTIKTATYNTFHIGCSWKPLLSAIFNSISGILQKDQYETCYFFSLYFPSTYLSAFILSEYTDCKITLISSNSPMYAMNRYIHIPKSNLILCSKYQEEEYKNYVDRMWIQVENCELWGLEEQQHYNSVTFEDPIFDIGIFSDASWARIDGVWRAQDLNKIKQGKYIQNRKYKALEDIIDTCCELKSQYDISVKVYLHPHERALINQHNISPPFITQLDRHGIPYSKKGTNSIDSISESEIGISSSSTIIMDRWHLGFKGLIHFDPLQLGQPFYHNSKHFGKYEEFSFTDKKSLIQSIFHLLERDISKSSKNFVI